MLFFFSLFLQIFVRRPKRKYAKVIYGRCQSLVTFFFLLYCGRLRACVYVSEREQMGEEVKSGRIASRVPKASTFCYAIARSWRRHSIKRRTRHHGRPINPQTKVDYDFSRGHRSRLLLRPVHTHERVHRFFWPTCTVDEFEYRPDRRELLRPASLVHREISFCFFSIPFFILT